MNKQSVISKIKKVLSQKEEVVFAYLFGSFVNREVYRDIDIAIFASPRIDLLELGRLTTRLESQLKRDVDLIELNDLPDIKPALAHEIVTYGQLLLDRDPEFQKNYKEKAWLSYFDTSRLREMMDQAFTERLESNKFGQRDYE